MKALDIDLVQPGMILAYPISRNGFVLGKGAKLTAGILHKLQRAGFERLCVIMR